LIIDRIDQAIAKDKPQLLIVDYLQLVRTGRNLPDKTGEINECLVRLRELTMLHEMSTVIVTNVAKGVTEDTDIGNIGKGSNQIDFDCDNLLYGHRIEEKSDDGGQMLGWKCKKLRQGQMQDLKLWFYGHLQCFEDPQEMVETDFGHVREVERFPEFEADRA
jgi:Replicative DNA helicase